nr:unnamed protein product [Digitaria exilis]
MQQPDPGGVGAGAGFEGAAQPLEPGAAREAGLGNGGRGGAAMAIGGTTTGVESASIRAVRPRLGSATGGASASTELARLGLALGAAGPMRPGGLQAALGGPGASTGATRPRELCAAPPGKVGAAPPREPNAEALTGGGPPEAQGMGTGHRAWLQGMDPNSTFTLKIRLFGNNKKMREGYTYGYFELVIDSDLSNYKDLVGEIVEKRLSGYLEFAHCQYYDDVLNNFPEIKSDQDLMLMFKKHSKTKDSYLCNPLPENEHVGVDEEVLYLEKAPVEVVAEDNDKECFGHGDDEGDGGDDVVAEDNDKECFGHGDDEGDGGDDGEGGDDGDSELEIGYGSELESDP